MSRARNSISSLAIAALVGVAFSAAPVGLDDQFAPAIKSAFAKGAGNSSGKGGGKSASKNNKSNKSNKSGQGGDSDLDTAGGGEEDNDKIGNGHIKAKGNGHAKNHDGEGDANEQGKLSSSLGNLNAAHASPTALEHASSNSMVGLLATYADAVNSGDPAFDDETEQQAELGKISNKTDGEPVDEEVVAEVNRLLGLTEEEAPPVVTP